MRQGWKRLIKCVNVVWGPNPGRSLG